MELLGFSLLRNAIKYDYPFRESLLSLAGLCSKVHLALGRSEDGTEKEVASLERTEIIPTVWDDNLREGGLVLSQQTNIALKHLRQNTSGKNTWAFYLQSDEVINEDDYALIKKDIQLAHQGGYDAISFRYLHFWQDYQQIAINKKWYPHEIRCFKANSAIESWGDAQSFKNAQKIFFSDARIYHYGHVRHEKAYELKKSDFHKLWHEDDEITKIMQKSQKLDQKHETIRYLGPHPEVMKERILSSNPTLTWPCLAPQKEALTIVASFEDYSDSFKRAIHAQKIDWKKDLKNCKHKALENVVFLKNAPWHKRILHPNLSKSHIPNAMRSKKARPWPLDFLAILKLSEKYIAVNKYQENL